MPLNLHIPLPGPFSHSKRIGRRRRKPGEHGIQFWLIIGWWLIRCVWLLLLPWWCCKATWRAADRMLTHVRERR
jgi:hypothetical protein